MSRKKNGAFTPLEIFILLFIVCVVAAIFFPIVTGYIENSRQTVANSNAEALMIAATSAMARISVTDLTIHKQADNDFTVKSFREKDFVDALNSLLKTGIVQNADALTIEIVNGQVLQTFYTYRGVFGSWPAGAKIQP